MGRTEQKQVVNQGTAQSAQSANNAQGALTATNKSLGDYSSNLDKFMNFGRSTYGANGEYAKDQNTIANTTAAAGQNNLAGNLALNKMRTGNNTANYAPTVAESQRQSSKDLTNQLATADTNRLQQLTNVNQFGVQASALPAQVQSGLYGTSVGGQSGNLSAAAGSANQPGFLDQLTGELISGGATVGAAFCPCAGSLIRMADGTDKAVEDVVKGDYVWPMSTLNPPNEILDKPEPVEQECFEIETKTGLKHRASATHTLALASGGYGYMPELEGKVVISNYFTDLVIAVRAIGKQKVYPMQVGGSHCYFADELMVLA